MPNKVLQQKHLDLRGNNILLLVYTLFTIVRLLTIPVSDEPVHETDRKFYIAQIKLFRSNEAGVG